MATVERENRRSRTPSPSLSWSPEVRLKLKQSQGFAHLSSLGQGVAPYIGPPTLVWDSVTLRKAVVRDL